MVPRPIWSAIHGSTYLIEKKKGIGCPHGHEKVITTKRKVNEYEMNKIHQTMQVQLQSNIAELHRLCSEYSRKSNESNALQSMRNEHTPIHHK